VGHSSAVILSRDTLTLPFHYSGSPAEYFPAPNFSPAGPPAADSFPGLSAAANYAGPRHESNSDNNELFYRMQNAMPSINLSGADLMSRSMGSVPVGPFAAAQFAVPSPQLNWDESSAMDVGRYLAVQQEILRQQARANLNAAASSPGSVPAIFFPAPYQQAPMFPVLEQSHLWARPAVPENAFQKSASKSLNLNSDSRPPVHFLPRGQSIGSFGVLDYTAPPATVALAEVSKTPSNSPLATMSNSSRSTGATLVATDSLRDPSGRFVLGQLPWDEVVAGNPGKDFQGSPDSYVQADLAPNDVEIGQAPVGGRRGSSDSGSETRQRKASGPATKRTRKKAAPSNLRLPSATGSATVPETSAEKISAHALNRAANEMFGCAAADLTAAQARKCKQQILTKRSRNTEAARRSRGKRREHVEEMEARLETLITENDGLRAQVLELETLVGVRR